MKKIPTLFVRDPKNMSLVTREVNPECAAFYETMAIIPTLKMDGTNIRVTLEDGNIVLVEKRRNVSREQRAQGEEPGYVVADRNDPADQYIFMAVDGGKTVYGTFCPSNGQHCAEALGAKIQGGVEGDEYRLYYFDYDPIKLSDLKRGADFSYDKIRDFLENNVIEGIVFTYLDYDEASNARVPKLCKIKRRDFGFEWPVKQKK